MALLLAVLVAFQEKTAEQFIQELRSSSVESRREAVGRLKELGKTAVPELERALSDADPEVAHQAKQLLRCIAIRDRLTPNLTKVVKNIEDRLSLSDPHTWTQEFLKIVTSDPTAGTFKGLKTEDLQVLASPALRGATTTDEKVGTCRAISRFRLSQAVPELIRLAEDTDREAQAEAIETLALVGNSETVPFLTSLLRNHRREGVRARAASALALLDAKEAIPDIVGLLKENSRASGDAALALASLGATDAIPLLVGMLKSEDSYARWAGALALGSLRAMDAAGDIAKLTKDSESLVREFAARALGDLGAVGHLPVIVGLLKDPHREVRRMALATLARLGDEACLPSILALGKVADADERQSIIQSLERFPTSRASSIIEGFLEDDDAKVQLQAANSLCRRGAMKGVPLVLKSAKSLSSLNGIRSPEAWKRIRGTRLTEPVLKGTPKAMMEYAARKSGFALEWNLPQPEDDILSWMGSQRSLTGGEWTILGLIDWLEDCGPCSTIVEADRIRICSREEARNFWDAWWKRTK